MVEEAAGKYGIEELAERAGVTRRTVRYYVQRGLLPTPTGLGRGKHYTQEHLDTLIRIRELQESGVSLDEIAAREHGHAAVRLAARATGPGPGDDGARQISWVRITLGDGVELHLRERRLSDARLRALVTAVSAALHGEDT